MGFTNYPLPVEEINLGMEKELEYSQYLNKMFENNCRKQSV